MTIDELKALKVEHDNALTDTRNNIKDIACRFIDTVNTVNSFLRNRIDDINFIGSEEIKAHIKCIARDFVYIADTIDTVEGYNVIVDGADYSTVSDMYVYLPEIADSKTWWEGDVERKIRVDGQLYKWIVRRLEEQRIKGQTDLLQKLEDFICTGLEEYERMYDEVMDIHVKALADFYARDRERKVEAMEDTNVTKVTVEVKVDKVVDIDKLRKAVEDTVKSIL